MPQTHSALYDAPNMVTTVASEQQLNALTLTSWMRRQTLPTIADGTGFYDQMSDLLRETNDAQFGIVSKLVDGEWVRDATASLSLAGRIPHDSPVIEANNALLRCLSRLRAIDYAIAEKYPGGEGLPIREALKTRLATLTNTILTAAQGTEDADDKLKEIKRLETDFDTFLIARLYDANLTKGCETAKDAEKLLSHYRNLSSLLVPARTMITLTYDSEAGVFQRETQFPVTEKTSEQKAALRLLRDINPHPLKENKTSHTVRNIATQEADSLFVGLLERDDRALPAQTRKTHLVGAKNAFIVKNELIFAAAGEGPDSEALRRRVPAEGDTLWLGRSGVPVYIGKGERDDTIAASTLANLEQVRMAAKTRKRMSDGARLDLHITSLNTVSPFEHQDTMVRHLYKATRKRPGGDDISYMPTNLDGTFRFVDIAPTLVFSPGETRPGGSAPLQKATRLEGVSAVMLKATEKPDTLLSVVQCASGQDRTGTAVEKTTQKWMAARYEAAGKVLGNIQAMRAKGGNAAEIATHHLPGSPGMKMASIADNSLGMRTTFDPLATKQFYRASADTNKKSPVGDVLFLKTPSPKAEAEYNQNLERFEIALREYKNSTGNRLKFYNQGVSLIERMNAITNRRPASVDATTLADLNAVLVYGKLALTHPEDANNIKKLAGLAQNASEKANRKEFSETLMMFACLALVVAGVILAIPTGGLSLMASAVGAIGLGVMGVRESKTELEHEVTHFKSALDSLHKTSGPSEVPPPAGALPESPVSPSSSRDTDPLIGDDGDESESEGERPGFR